MTILVDWQIEEVVSRGDLIIEPFDNSLIQPNSIDVRLSRHFSWHDAMEGHKWAKPADRIIDPYDPSTILADMKHAELDEIVLEPGRFVLGATLEKIKLPSTITAQLTGKSSLARLGIAVHVTAGFIDAGFSDPPCTVTLEIANFNCRPVRLYAGMGIGQLIFTRTEPCDVPYNLKKNSKYNNQQEAAHSKYYLNKKP